MVYFSKLHFSAEPVCTNHDPYSLTFTFFPIFSGTVKPVIKTKNGSEYLAPYVIRAFDPLSISFGPLDISFGETITCLLFQESESPNEIFLCQVKNYDPSLFNRAKVSFQWTMYIASCFRLPNDYSKTPVSLDAYQKFAEQYRSQPSDMIISLGDTIYLQNSQTNSTFAVLERYKSMFTFPYLQESFSNSWWVAVVDDHDLGINDTIEASYNIGMIRSMQQKVFPRVSYGQPDTVNSLYNINDITMIFLDDISHRKYDILQKNYQSILGQEQLEWFLQSLVNAKINYGSDAIILVVEGKSWFGSFGGQTYTSCPYELNTILNTIQRLGLTGVYHLCGDSHFSDQSYYPLEKGGIVEFRNSPMGSVPRKNIMDNPYRVPGSLVDINNFGNISITGIPGKYQLEYKVFTKDGISYTWKS